MDAMRKPVRQDHAHIPLTPASRRRRHGRYARYRPTVTPQADPSVEPKLRLWWRCGGMEPASARQSPASARIGPQAWRCAGGYVAAASCVSACKFDPVFGVIGIQFCPPNSSGRAHVGPIPRSVSAASAADDGGIRCGTGLREARDRSHCQLLPATGSH